MSEPVNERLYKLLPAIYRIRDADQGEVLRALLGVVEEEFLAIEQDIAGLYEDMFIETCDEWVIPYIGDLLNVHGVYPISARAGSLRSYVANTIAYRRRKGTAAVLEQVARDITGWPAHAVEFFQLLGTTQHLNHLRMDNVRTPDMRDTNNLQLLGGPFETAAHTADIRSPKTARGKYNIPNIGIFLWRLQSYPVDRTTAREVPGKGYTFDPTGKEIPLFNQPKTEENISHLAEEINVPAPLRRLPLYNELEARRKALISSKTPKSIYFGKQPVLSLSLIYEDQSQPDVILPEDIRICDLTNWGNPPASPGNIRAAVDPVLGKLVLSNSISPKPLEVLVSYSYGFSHDVGAGPYTRTDFTHQVLNRQVDWQVGVRKEETGVGIGNIFPDLASAVEEWNKQPKGTVGVIAIMDSRTYQDELTDEYTIKIPDSSQLLVTAADWPVIEDQQRRMGQFAATGLRPHLLGDIHISGKAGVNNPNPGELVLDGILIEGKISVLEGNLGGLQVGHCTIVPRYLFSWGKVPGNDNGRLIEFLMQYFNVEWMNAAKIEKKADGKTIMVTNDTNYLSLTLNDEKTNVNLEIDDGRTDIFIVKTENGELNIYVPGNNGIEVLSSGDTGKSNDALKLTIRQTICGGILLPETVPGLDLIDSIIGMDGNTAIYAKGTTVSIEQCTILGRSYMRKLEASNSIFKSDVEVEQRQAGCMRFCFVPYDSSTPRRFQCQPDLALSKQAIKESLHDTQDTHEHKVPSVEDLPENIHDAVLDRLQPVFTSLIYGSPAYSQLSPVCPVEIFTGAEDNSEMGVFSTLQQPQREKNLLAALEEYLRFGLEAGIFYVT